MVKYQPRIVRLTECVAIFDDFLPLRLWEEVFSYCNQADYELVHRSKIRKVWRLHDGMPLQGKTFYLHKADIWPGTESSSYPTNTIIDRFFEALEDSLHAVEKTVGVSRTHWVTLSAAPWVYPVASGLSLHQDGTNYSGAYAYYAHPKWNIHWGGYLIVLEEQTQAVWDLQKRTGNSALYPPWLDDTMESKAIWEPGIATCVFPKPNRIVFLSPSAPHMITRVEPAAGMAARVSIAGFFLRNYRKLSESD